MKFPYAVYYFIVYPFIKIIFPCRFKGKTNIPKGPAIVCANHSSLLDPILIALAFGPRRQLFFMAKAELFKIPVLKNILNSAGVFPVERGETDINAIRKAMKHLKNGEQIMMFPEGTRVGADESAAAKSGAVRIAAKLNVPILPVYISNNKKAFRMSKLIIGEPYKLNLTEGRDYSRLSEELMQKIKELESAV